MIITKKLTDISDEVIRSTTSQWTFFKEYLKQYSSRQNVPSYKVLLDFAWSGHSFLSKKWTLQVPKTFESSDNKKKSVHIYPRIWFLHGCSALQQNVHKCFTMAYNIPCIQKKLKISGIIWHRHVCRKTKLSLLV